MKNVTLASIAALLVTTATLPALAAADSENAAVNATVNTTNVKGQGLRFFHHQKKVALKVNQGDTEAVPGGDLDYGGEYFPIFPGN